MQDIIVLIILLLIVGAAARYVYKAKKNGARCIGCSASGYCSAKSRKDKADEIVLTPEIEAAFPHVYTIGVEGMTCSNCTGHVEKAFFSAGYLCKADLSTHTVQVRSRQPVDPEILGKIVTDAGYVYVA